MNSPRTYIKDLIEEKVSIAPLVVFRILFGALMAVGGVRFIFSGWIDELYIQPSFNFKFFGFEWVVVPETAWVLYGLHILIVLSALGIALGWKYRWSAVLFFLTFSYAEMMDATNYLNHYYLVILVAFLMIFLPAHRAFSIDAWLNPDVRQFRIPRLYTEVLKWQVGLVYVFAGLAKLNYDWIFHAMPLAVWLPARADIPVLGMLFQESWTPFLFSWVGALYDLSIVLLLTHRRWWAVGYLLVIVFHMMTWLLFNIGMFPFIMICFTTIFIPVKYHDWVLHWFRKLFRGKKVLTLDPVLAITSKSSNPIWQPLPILYTLLIGFQLFMPLRHYLYSGSVHWNEEGYRWSWRVMLLEKSGIAVFTVEDTHTGRRFEVSNSRFLTPYQEKQMAFQPDFILQYAHHLESYYKEKLDADNLKITVRSQVSLNGRKSRPLINPETDLTTLRNSWSKKGWILPYETDLGRQSSSSEYKDILRMRNPVEATSVAESSNGILNSPELDIWLCLLYDGPELKRIPPDIVSDIWSQEKREREMSDTFGEPGNQVPDTILTHRQDCKCLTPMPTLVSAQSRQNIIEKVPKSKSL